MLVLGWLLGGVLAGILMSGLIGRPVARAVTGGVVIVAAYLVDGAAVSEFSSISLSAFVGLLLVFWHICSLLFFLAAQPEGYYMYLLAICQGAKLYIY